MDVPSRTLFDVLSHFRIWKGICRSSHWTLLNWLGTDSPPRLRPRPRIVLQVNQVTIIYFWDILEAEFSTLILLKKCCEVSQRIAERKMMMMTIPTMTTTTTTTTTTIALAHQQRVTSLLAASPLLAARRTLTQTSSTKMTTNAAAKAQRPVSPHLTIYNWQLTNTLSAAHRITGAGLAGGKLDSWLVEDEVNQWKECTWVPCGTLWLRSLRPPLWEWLRRCPSPCYSLESSWLRFPSHSTAITVSVIW